MSYPQIIYGTAWKEERTAELVELALASGFIGLDTAAQPKHYQEDLVGAALKNALRAGMSRDSLFIQTKFTPLDGQDSRVPYDMNAPLPTQVRQSCENSLLNLGVDFIDSYLLHGPYSHPGLISSDWQVWKEMESLHDEGRVGVIGISNVNSQQLTSLIEQARVKPSFVQNRCYASRGWDHEVRAICSKFGVIYQGFSLLTANPKVVHSETVRQISESLGKTPQQVIYRFASQLGMIPLCGSTNITHMNEALTIDTFELTPEEIELIKSVE
ncbi:MAG: aldo/keto reductase [Bdellovibrionales bacterium]|nr:aldo/keto reductase [Bdellovibrionales bacterium]